MGLSYATSILGNSPGRADRVSSSPNGYQEIYVKPNPCSTTARANVPARYRPLAFALLLTSTLLSACGGSGGDSQTASADAKTPQMRCAQ